MNDSIRSSWKSVPFRTVNMYFYVCWRNETVPTWLGLRRFALSMKEA